MNRILIAEDDPWSAALNLGRISTVGDMGYRVEVAAHHNAEASADHDRR